MNAFLKKLIPIATPFLPLIIIGALAGIAFGTKMFVYVWTDPSFCTTCHVHDYANTTWKKSPHGNVTYCMNCHQQPLALYFRQLAVFATRHPHFPADMRRIPHVRSQSCRDCHSLDHSYLHTLHLKTDTHFPLPRDISLKDQETQFGILSKPMPTVKASRKVECVDCHGTYANRAHVLTVSDRSCIQCHATSHETQLVKKYGCRVCHAQDFLTPLETPERKRQRQRLGNDNLF